jgi:hypothetical protein
MAFSDPFRGQEDIWNGLDVTPSTLSFLLTSFFLLSYLLLKPYGKRYTRFLIKICGYHDGIYVKMAPASFFSCGTGERYVTLPFLTQSARDFAIKMN